MFTEITKTRGGPPFRGWVFFDAECPACLRLARRFGPALKRRGYRLNPLQDAWVSATLRLSRQQLMEEMKLLTPDSTLIGGADAILRLARAIPWLTPVYWISRLPGMHHLFVIGYRWFAGRRYCGIEKGATSCART